MKDSVAAERYARAIFAVAKEKNSLEPVENSFASFVARLKSEPKISAVMNNPAISAKEKITFSKAVLGSTAPSILLDFFSVIIEKKRFALLPEIQETFHMSFEKYSGIQEVKVLSAVSLSPSFLNRLQETLAKKLKTKIRLLTSVQKDLLGGFVVRFAGKEIDCSFKNRLDEIKQKLFDDIEEGISHA